MVLALLAELSLAAVKLKLKPDSTALPGASTAEKLLNGLTYYAIIGLLVGAIFGLVQWGLGSRSNNYGQAGNGKKTVGVCIAGVFFVGALSTIVNFALQSGGTVK